MSILSSTNLIRQNAGWLIAIGLLNILIGALAFVFTGVFTLASVAFLGAFWVVTGVAEIILAVRLRGQGGLWFHLLMGVLGVVVGSLVLLNPLENTVVLTLLIAILFMVSGLVKGIGALIDRGENWTWILLNGAISVILGGLIFQMWPLSSLWTIGLLVGADFFMSGATLFGLGLRARQSRGAVSSRPVTA